MKEMQLQLFWLNHANKIQLLRDINELPVEIVSPGILNFDQGPDFLYGNIKIDGVEWIGAIEIHQKTSDWYSHQHQNDPHYQKVVLHVVWEHNLRSFDQCAVLELSNYVSFETLNLEITNRELFNSVFSYPDLELVERLALSRLEEKANGLLVDLKYHKGDWNAIFWKKVGYTFGLPLNGNSFARMIDALNSIHHSSLKMSTVDLKSLLMFMAGYSSLLTSEEIDISKRLLAIYRLKTSTMNMLHFRTRPSNLPSKRLVQLSDTMVSNADLFRLVIEESNLNLLFGRFSSTMSRLMFDRLLINVFVPILIVYSKYTGVLSHRFKAIDWLQVCPPENNKVTRKFTKFFFQPTAAIQSQGILEWYKRMPMH